MSYYTDQTPAEKRVRAYLRALDIVGDRAIVGTKYPPRKELFAIYKKYKDMYDSSYGYQMAEKKLSRMLTNNTKRKWTKDDDAFLITAICEAVNPNSTASYDCTHTMSHVQRCVSDITGRTEGAIRQRCETLGLKKSTTMNINIVGKDGIPRSTKSGLPVEVPKPTTIDLKKQPKKKRTPVSHSSVKTINLGKSVRNVSISYTESGEMQITFEG